MSHKSPDDIRDLVLENSEGQYHFVQWLPLGAKIPKIPGFSHRGSSKFKRINGIEYVMITYHRSK